MKAAQEGNRELMRVYLLQDADFNERSANGNSALLWAVFNKNRALVDLLIEHNAEVNATNNLGQFPLCLAAHAGEDRITKKLLKAGADISMKFQDKTAAEWASSKDHKALAKLIQNWNTSKGKDAFGAGFRGMFD